MSDKNESAHKQSKPYKIVDYTRGRRKGITASSLEELLKIARMQYHFPKDTNITVVLEQDGKVYIITVYCVSNY
jgi:hypothetical protein